MKKVILAFIILLSFTLSAAELDKKIEQTFQTQMTAIKNNDYMSFTANGTPEFKKLSKQNFERVNGGLMNGFKSGHEEHYLTSLKQQGYQAYIWKISFKDGSDDLVAKMVMDKSGKVAGFWLQ